MKSNLFGFKEVSYSGCGYRPAVHMVCVCVLKFKNRRVCIVSEEIAGVSATARSRKCTHVNVDGLICGQCLTVSPFQSEISLTENENVIADEVATNL